MENVSADEAARAWQLGLPPTAALINCACLRPNGCLLALQCDPDRCAVLDLTGIPQHPPSQVQVLGCERGGGLEVAACAWSPSGNHFLVAWVGKLGAVQLYQMVEGQQRLELVLDHALFFWPRDVSVIDDGHGGLLLAVAGAPGVVLYRLSQVGGGAWQARQVRRLCHLWPACQVALAEGHLAATGLGGQLWVWDTAVASTGATPEEHLQLQTQVPAERVTSLAFAPDGAMLVAGCWGGGIHLYHKAGSRWAGAKAQHSSSATGASAAAVPSSDPAPPARGLAAGPPCAAAVTSPPAVLGPAAPAAQLPEAGSPAGSAVQAAAGGVAAEAAACAPVPGEQQLAASGLAAVDHGERGSGGWVIGKGLPGVPVSAEATPPALMAWAGGRTLAVTRAGSHFLECFRLDDTCSLVRVAVHGARSGCDSPAVQTQCKENNAADEPQQDGGLPLGLRVLPLSEGLRTGPVKQVGLDEGRETRDVGCCSAAVKGLAVFKQASGTGLLAVTYDRDCQLQVHVLGTDKR